jgi:hypothetical protein
VSLAIEKLGDGDKNVTVWVRGEFAEAERSFVVLDIGDLRPRPKVLSLASLVWCMEDKLCTALWLDERRRDPADLLAFMESRHKLELSRPIVLKDVDKLWLERVGPDNFKGSLFWLVLDFDKSGVR